MPMPTPKPTPKPTPMPKPTPTPKPNPFVGMPTGYEDLSAEAEDIEFALEALRLMNIERAKVGSQPLIYNYDLTRAARYHIADIAYDGYWGHNIKDNVNGEFITVGTFADFKVAFGNTMKETWPAAEIMCGGVIPSDTIDAFMFSPKHKEAMLEPQLKYIGIATINGNLIALLGI